MIIFVHFESIMQLENIHTTKSGLELDKAKKCFRQKDCCHLSISFGNIIITIIIFFGLLFSIHTAPLNSPAYWHKSSTAFAQYPANFAQAGFGPHGSYVYAPMIQPPMPFPNYGRQLPYKMVRPGEVQYQRKRRSRGNKPKKKVAIGIDRRGQQMVRQLKGKIAEAEWMISGAYGILNQLAKQLKRLTFSLPRCEKCAARQEQPQPQSQVATQSESSTTPTGSEESSEDSSDSQRESEDQQSGDSESENVVNDSRDEPQYMVQASQTPAEDETSADESNVIETKLIEENFSDDESDLENEFGGNKVDQQAARLSPSAPSSNNNAISYGGVTNDGDRPTKSRPSETMFNSRQVNERYPSDTFSRPPPSGESDSAKNEKQNQQRKLEEKQQREKEQAKVQEDPSRVDEELRANLNRGAKGDVRSEYGEIKPEKQAASFRSTPNSVAETVAPNEGLDQKRALDSVTRVENTQQQTVVASIEQPNGTLDDEDDFPGTEGPRKQGAEAGGGGEGQVGNNNENKVNQAPQTESRREPFVFNAQRQIKADSLMDGRPSGGQPNYLRQQTHRSSYSISSSGGGGRGDGSRFRSLRKGFDKVKQGISKSPIVYGAMEKARNHAKPHMASAMEQARDTYSLLQDGPFGEGTSAKVVHSSSSKCPHCGSHTTTTSSSFVSAPAPSKPGSYPSPAAASPPLSSKPMRIRQNGIFPPMPAMPAMPPMPPMPPMPNFPGMPKLPPLMSLQQPFGGPNKRRKLNEDKPPIYKVADHDNSNQNEVYEHDTGPIISVSPDGLSRHEHRHRSSGVISRDGNGSFKKSSSSFSSSSSSSSSSFNSNF